MLKLGGQVLKVAVVRQTGVEGTPEPFHLQE